MVQMDRLRTGYGILPYHIYFLIMNTNMDMHMTWQGKLIFICQKTLIDTYRI